MNHRLQCKCGALTGLVSNTREAVRGVCYCKDCRAYSNHLGDGPAVYDALGGIELVATQAKYVSFDSGVENLACCSLSKRGLLRWYAKCCNTPIANTTRNLKFPYVGLVHSCLTADQDSFVRSFPGIQMRVNTASAFAAAPTMPVKTLVSLAFLIPKVLMGGFNGTYKQTPFFSAVTGLPVVPVDVLSAEQRQQARQADSAHRD